MYTVFKKDSYLSEISGQDLGLSDLWRLAASLAPQCIYIHVRPSYHLIWSIWSIIYWFFCCIVSIILLSKSSKSKYNLSIKHIYTSVTNTESLARFETCEVQTAAWQFTKPHTGHTDDRDDSTCTIHARQHKTTQNHTTHGTARLLDFIA